MVTWKSLIATAAAALASSCTPAAPSGFGTFAEEQALSKSKVDCVAEQFWIEGEWYCWLKEDKPTPELIAARQAGNQDDLNRILEDAKKSSWSVRMEIVFEGDRNAASFG